MRVSTIHVIWCFLFSLPTYAVNYYVSNSGNDANIGTSPATAWQTINKLNASWSFITSGDTIFFRCGDIFSGMVQPTKDGTLSNPIVMTSYGSGAKPIIQGTRQVTNWVSHSGHIWKADLTGFSTNNIESIYANDMLLTPSRFPNSGFLFATSDNDSITLVSTQITQPAGYWNGAFITHRSRNWVWERRVVNSHTTNQINVTLATDFSYTTQSGRGFFFTNKLSELDTAGEWFYDNATKIMYAWFPSNTNPATLQVEVPIWEWRYGLLLNARNHWIIDNIAFKGGSWGGVRAQNGENITVKNCHIFKTSGTAIFYNSLVRGVIQNNLIEHNINNGVRLVNCRFYDVSYNKIRQCGRETNYINGYDRWGIATSFGYKGRITYNQIDSVGSSGVLMVDSLSLIEKNIINFSCAELTDNGGIYLVDAGRNKTTTRIYADTIRHNFVSNTRGFTGGTSSTSTLVQGMDISDYSGFCVIENNTVYNGAEKGYKIFGGFNNVVRNNIAFGNEEAQMSVGTSLSLFKVDVVADNVVKNNLFVSTSEDQNGFRLYADSTFFNFGSYDSNYYYNPYGKYTFDLSWESGPTSFFRLNFLSRWKVSPHFSPPQDQNSKEVIPFLLPYKIHNTVGSNLVLNGNFDANIANWTSHASAIWVSTGGINGGTFRVGNASSGSITTRSSTFSIVAGKTYRVKLSCRANRAAKLRFALQKENTATLYSKYKYVEVNTDIKNHEFIFVPTVTASDAQFVIRTQDDDINFQYFIDSVEIIEVNTTPIPTHHQIELLTNPSDTVRIVHTNGKVYKDLEHNLLCDTLHIAPWYSRAVLVQDSYTDSIYTGSSVIAENSGTNNCSWRHVKTQDKFLVSINPNGQNLGTITVNTWIDNTTIQNNTNYFAGRRFKITTQNAPTQPVQVRLYFTQNEINQLIAASSLISQIQEITVLHWKGNNQDGLLSNNTIGIEDFIMGSALNIATYQNGYFVEFEVSEFSEFWIGDKTFTPLSVQLFNFTAQKEAENKVLLQWNVSRNNALQYFEVERAWENNPKQFENIGKIDYQLDKEHYVWNDNVSKPLTEMVYYRLKIYEQPTQYTYSAVRPIWLGNYNQFDVKVFPNPASSVVHIQTNADEKIMVNIISVLSELVHQQSIQKATDVDITPFNNGIYLLQFINTKTGSNQTKRLIIQH